MKLQIPDRVPLMCQLSLGHYFLFSGLNPLDIWYTSEGFAEALIKMQERYGFDGILINLPGRDPNYERFIQTIEKKEDKGIIHWQNGAYTIFPPDDNPHYYSADGSQFFPTFEEIDPEKLYYVEPFDLTQITYPYTWGFEHEPRPFEDYFPEYHFDTIKKVKESVGATVSVHAEIFSPWSQFLELLNYERGLMAILEDAEKVKSCLQQLTFGALVLARKQARCDVNAILISSAFAGAEFISRQHYQEFVLPYEKQITAAIQKEFNIPVYTHTCGLIADRLDLMLETGTDGIDTLDPPPIGNVELEGAKKELQGRAFIKGNVDPINTLLRGTPEVIKKDVEWRLVVGKPGGGYILSTACSVAPYTPPENIELLTILVDEFGAY